MCAIMKIGDLMAAHARGGGHRAVSSSKPVRRGQKWPSPAHFAKARKNNRMNLPLQEAKEIMARSDGSLDLSKSQYAQLPEGLSVPGDLNLHRAKISILPENLSVGGNPDLQSPTIAALPEGLSVGGSLIGKIDP